MHLRSDCTEILVHIHLLFGTYSGRHWSKVNHLVMTLFHPSCLRRAVRKTSLITLWKQNLVSKSLVWKSLQSLEQKSSHRLHIVDRVPNASLCKKIPGQSRDPSIECQFLSVSRCIRNVNIAFVSDRFDLHQLTSGGLRHTILYQ